MESNISHIHAVLSTFITFLCGPVTKTYAHEVHKVSICGVIGVKSGLFNPLGQFVKVSSARHANALDDVQSLRGAVITEDHKIITTQFSCFPGWKFF